MIALYVGLQMSYFWGYKDKMFQFWWTVTAHLWWLAGRVKDLEVKQFFPCPNQQQDTFVLFSQKAWKRVLERKKKMFGSMKMFFFCLYYWQEYWHRKLHKGTLITLVLRVVRLMRLGNSIRSHSAVLLMQRSRVITQLVQKHCRSWRYL